ncbi:competence protein CoiA [Escherichia coli]|uniref:competence protein CoiA n=2 Tax=Escherichia coli TaxID=562 RepID=UPI000854D9CB|nr:hypothetical protein [Escherichia coli]MEC9927314.1 hypothetical protein [Escherichia marmotae]MCV9094767.1 hypothetical protein [Escherichia coli]MDI0489260.1 hypothetical protein [Escherichia coli]MDI0548692.1 hypothetical protein [Escherichia coli]MDI0553726.1 hypothetical protein [Escherichia coli]
MPLKASLNSKEIHSFEFNFQKWEHLKQTYKSQSLLMLCCGQPGIPKTSKLNNYYFAHKSKGDCPYAKESAEHLYLKFLIAKLASDAGWSVTTEKQGMTPAGEQWIADVFCTRNNAKLVFEVQLSPQKDDEFKERQKRYIASGVRALWLRKLRKGSKERGGGIYHSYDLPVFGMRQNENGDLYLPQFGVSVREFIAGIFARKLLWFPKVGDVLTAKIESRVTKCWRCKKRTGIIRGISVYSKSAFVKFLSFRDSDVKELIVTHVDNKKLWAAGIGTVKARCNEDVGYYYLSNGCIHCDSLIGDFFLLEIFDYPDYKPKVMIEFSFTYASNMKIISGGWIFDGKKAEMFF